MCGRGVSSKGWRAGRCAVLVAEGWGWWDLLGFVSHRAVPGRNLLFLSVKRAGSQLLY